MILFNCLNTSDIPQPNGMDWIDLCAQNKKINICPACGKLVFCKLVGGHLIELTNEGEAKVCIVPICESCNSKRENLKPFNYTGTPVYHSEELSDRILNDEYAGEDHIPNKEYIEAVKRYLNMNNPEDFEQYITRWKEDNGYIKE